MDCRCVGDWGFEIKVDGADGAIWLNRSKNVLFRLDNVLTGDFGVGVVEFDGIGMGFDGTWAMLVDWLVGAMSMFAADADDDEDDVGDEAK